jgi:hypothetical protein
MDLNTEPSVTQLATLSTKPPPLLVKYCYKSNECRNTYLWSKMEETTFWVGNPPPRPPPPWPTSLWVWTITLPPCLSQDLLSVHMSKDPTPKPSSPQDPWPTILVGTHPHTTNQLCISTEFLYSVPPLYVDWLLILNVENMTTSSTTQRSWRLEGY